MKMARRKIVTGLCLNLLTVIPSVLAQAQPSSTPGVPGAIDPALIGTWTTSSRKVFTGPGFYDPVHDRLLEPDFPGVSYSFTNDGHYEEAYYRTGQDPGSSQCPTTVLQWQHGTFAQYTNSTLILTPISVDGRQIMSDPCNNDNSVYTRYHQAEIFQTYEVTADDFHGVKRLDLFKFDGSPMNAMYLAYNPPQMLPYQTLNPTTSGNVASSTPTPSGTAAVQRRNAEPQPDSFHPPLNAKALESPKTDLTWLKPDVWWWAGVGATAFGSVAYFWI